MAKGRRTRKQKVSAKRDGLTYKLPRVTNKAEALEGRKSQYKQSGSFGYDPRLILTDLTKTVVLSILAVATIVAIYYFKLI